MHTWLRPALISSLILAIAIVSITCHVSSSNNPLPSVLPHPALCFHPQLEAAEAAGLHDAAPVAAADVLQAQAVSTAAAGPLEEAPALQVWGCAAIKQDRLQTLQCLASCSWWLTAYYRPTTSPLLALQPAAVIVCFAPAVLDVA